MGKLSTVLCGIGLDNPVIPASGTFGYGYEFAELYDINILGAFSCKGTTLEPRFGNPLPRIAETPAGMLNAIGLQNPGADRVLSEELPRLRQLYRKKILANIGGFPLRNTRSAPGGWRRTSWWAGWRSTSPAPTSTGAA